MCFSLLHHPPETQTQTSSTTVLHSSKYQHHRGDLHQHASPNSSYHYRPQARNHGSTSSPPGASGRLQSSQLTQGTRLTCNCTAGGSHNQAIHKSDYGNHHHNEDDEDTSARHRPPRPRWSRTNGFQPPHSPYHHGGPSASPSTQADDGRQDLWRTDEAPRQSDEKARKEGEFTVFVHRLLIDRLTLYSGCGHQENARHRRTR